MGRWAIFICSLKQNIINEFRNTAGRCGFKIIELTTIKSCNEEPCFLRILICISIKNALQLFHSTISNILKIFLNLEILNFLKYTIVFELGCLELILSLEPHL